ncbi:hypothetical protein DB43_HD00440 [Parachlamydia acanthamoebae]|uniref:Uncharacterized protein n=1 Tax=Parachlamydia acanthamoebae TaxID=83552 RepID=A0A0C1EA16_9BACT|nr:hypothetical protein DB43_HD00440 [Parachlamydia acanthamoebae]
MTSFSKIAKKYLSGGGVTNSQKLFRMLDCFSIFCPISSRNDRRSIAQSGIVHVVWFKSDLKGNF